MCGRLSLLRWAGRAPGDQGNAAGDKEYGVERAPAESEDEIGVWLTKHLAQRPGRGLGEEKFTGNPAWLGLGHIGAPEPPLHEDQ